jgi:hypothetical protein
MVDVKYIQHDDVTGFYWFDGPRGKKCFVWRDGYSTGNRRWVAKGETWYGSVVCHGRTRAQAVEELIWALG